MVDLSTQYLGLNLANPLVPSASPLSKNIDTARRLEDAGASAIVMNSLFEEEIEREDQGLDRFFHQQSIGHGEADSFHPSLHAYQSHLEEYLERLVQMKRSLGIPVIASLNGSSLGGWIRIGKELQAAGADALELNIYYVAANPEESSLEVENRYVEVLQSLRVEVDIPITMKLSSQFSSLIPFVKRLADAGAGGVAIFNRFYQPDIDLNTLRTVPTLETSSSTEALLRIRWAALLFGKIKNMSLAVTGGFHSRDDVLKALLAGADVVHLCSELLDHGSGRITDILKEMEEWMVKKEYASVAQLKGSVSSQHAINPAIYERANYLQVIEHYRQPATSDD